MLCCMHSMSLARMHTLQRMHTASVGTCCCPQHALPLGVLSKGSLHSQANKGRAHASTHLRCHEERDVVVVDAGQVGLYACMPGSQIFGTSSLCKSSAQ